MKITYAEEKDIAAIAAAEAACFPPAEAATEQEFVEHQVLQQSLLAAV